MLTSEADSGVSIAIIKRIEGQTAQNISLLILIRLLRSMTQLECVGTLVPKLPDSKYNIKADGTKMTSISSNGEWAERDLDRKDIRSAAPWTSGQ